jgi:hypothetical protein
MSKLWLIQLFWLALALPGYALLRRWDRASLERGFLFGLARCYLASFCVLTPVAVLGYWRNWPLWSLSSVCVSGVLVGGAVLARDHRALVAALRTPNTLAAISCMLIGFDLWLGLRAGSHTQGDAGYHIARVRMLMAEGLSNWDPIVQQPRLDIIYHTNLYHALIAVSGQLTGSDATVAWLATWPFAKLLVAAGIGQLACCVFGSAAAGWLASLTALASQSAYSALPFPNTLAPMAVLPMGLCAAAELWAAPKRAQRAAAWLAASALALAQMHALNAIFLAMVVGPVLLAVLLLRSLAPWARGRGRYDPPDDPPPTTTPSPRVLVMGMLACIASLPWLVVAGAPRMQVLFQLALPTLQTAAPLPQPKERTETSLREDAKERHQLELAAPTPQPEESSRPTPRGHAEANDQHRITPAPQPQSTTESARPTVPTNIDNAPPQQPSAAASDQPQAADEPTRPHAAEPGKVVYKAERFRKLGNGMSVYEPDKLRGAHNMNLIMLAVVLITLLLRPRKQLGALALFATMTCAWLLVPALCSVLLFVTGAPWAALRIVQVLPVAFYALVPAAALFWLSRIPRSSRWTRYAEPPLAAAALLIGGAQVSHAEPWTKERVWEHALQYEARSQWQSSAARQALLCGPIPKGEVVMAHARWDYGLPMLCRNFVIALAPGRGWHGLAYMHERRSDVDEFFHERTSGQRRLELMRKYKARYVYTSQRIARRIVRSLPKTSKILAEARPGAVLEIDTKDTKEAGE